MLLCKELMESFARFFLFFGDWIFFHSWSGGFDVLCVVWLTARVAKLFDLRAKFATAWPDTVRFMWQAAANAVALLTTVGSLKNAQGIWRARLNWSAGRMRPVSRSLANSGLQDKAYMRLNQRHRFNAINKNENWSHNPARLILKHAFTQDDTWWVREQSKERHSISDWHTPKVFAQGVICCRAQK